LSHANCTSNHVRFLFPILSAAVGTPRADLFGNALRAKANYTRPPIAAIGFKHSTLIIVKFPIANISTRIVGFTKQIISAYAQNISKDSQIVG